MDPKSGIHFWVRCSRTQQVPPHERLQDLIGEHLRLSYAALLKEPIPDRLTALIDEASERATPR